MKKFILLFGLIICFLTTAGNIISSPTRPPVRDETSVVRPVRKSPTPTTTPATLTLDNFSKQVRDGQPIIRGIFIQNKLAFYVVQQPSSNTNYISGSSRTVTQSRTAILFGGIVFLAHNYSAGRVFPSVVVNDIIYTIYGDGKIDKYIVQKQYKYQALQPDNPYTNYVDLETGLLVTWDIVYINFYSLPDAIVLQTCISKDNIGSWGRLFITAIKG
jgi:hypothetical protein